MYKHIDYVTVTTIYKTNSNRCLYQTSSNIDNIEKYIIFRAKIIYFADAVVIIITCSLFT